MGYLVIQALAARMGWSLKEEKHFHAFVAKGTITDAMVHLLLPTTYMNLSGTAVRRYLDFFKLRANQVVVVVDDIAIPFGQLRLRPKGSAGGHNGLKSIEACLGTSDYIRLRMGIGQPQARDLVDHVLAPFNQEELKDLQTFIDRGVDVLLRLLKENLLYVMNAVNTAPPRTDRTPL
jgi:peptidyl-tRNA hydrolase, PTH1 family